MSESNNPRKMKIQYLENDKQGLDLIGPLWEKLKEYQKVRSQHFPDHYAKRTFDQRKMDLLEKAESGALRIDLARDLDAGELVGYCVSTISGDGQGRIESIYVEPNYRQSGIGDNLMQKALHWLDGMQAKTKMLIVGAGNEGVFTFYSRYNFHPKHITLEQVEK